MFKYTIIDAVSGVKKIKRGVASLEQLQGILPEELYEMFVLGTLEVNVVAGHVYYQVERVQ